jgi:hypothetical protein
MLMAANVIPLLLPGAANKTHRDGDTITCKNCLAHVRRTVKLFASTSRDRAGCRVIQWRIRLKIMSSASYYFYKVGIYKEESEFNGSFLLYLAKLSKLHKLYIVDRDMKMVMNDGLVSFERFGRGIIY